MELSDLSTFHFTRRNKMEIVILAFAVAIFMASCITSSENAECNKKICILKKLKNRKNKRIKDLEYKLEMATKELDHYYGK